VTEAEETTAPRRVRADARRNIDAVLEAAKAVFATAGVDAPVRDIATAAGVGVGTLYRHFPKRADLVAAVFRHEVDACADAAPVLAAEHGPDEALSLWLQRFTGFIATKRGLASALHSGDPTFDALPDYFEGRFLPALRSLLDDAAAAGAIRGDVDAHELLTAVAGLSMSEDPERPGRSGRMVALLVDGLRHRAGA
jgi:AcrR family transcriptional regulator